MTMEFLPDQLFDSFWEPVLLLRDGRVAYRNPAAAGPFPGLRGGEAVPPELAGLLDGAAPPAAVAGALGGRQWTATLTRLGEGTLVVLRAREETPERPSLSRLTVRLRQETAGLAAALQRLDPGGEEPERNRRYLSSANRSLHQLLCLTGHLEFLDLTDGEVYRPQGLDLAGLCRELSREVEGVCRLAGYRFTYDSELGSLITTGDGALLRRLMLALVSNAMKAAGPGGSLGLRLARSRDRAVITVWDHGAGVAGGDVARLFGGGETPALDPSQGLGLGLELVRRAAWLHGGAVMVEGRPGEGLRCVVSLPIRPPREGTSFRSPRADYAGGFSPLLVELSDVLPAECFWPEVEG